jgi:hypothetical protein
VGGPIALKAIGSDEVAFLESLFNITEIPVL